MNAPMTQVARSAIAPTPKQPPLYLWCQIAMVDGSVLGSETFRLVSFEGKERVSEPFEFTLSLHGDTDARAQALAFSQLIGRPVDLGVGLAMAPGAGSRNLCQRPGPDLQPQVCSVFNGMVASFGMQEPGVYQLVMRPTLWRMTLTNDYRIHRQMTVREALAALCRKHRVQANFDAISTPGNMAITRRQDWLQAGESDYEFMRRLMGKAHIYFYFSHQQGQHTLVFGNCASYPKVFDDDRPLRYTWSAADELGLHQWDVVSQYSFQQSLGVSGVRGVFAWQQQAANVNGGVATYARFAGNSPQDGGELPFHQYRIYQYGGSNGEVLQYTEASSDALRTGDYQLSGASYCALLRVGHQFRLAPGRYAYPEGYPLQPEFAASHFVLTEVSHRASLDGEYSNQFQATDATGLITPLSVADTQQGAVLARVVAHRALHEPGVWPYYTPDNFDDQTETQQAPANSLKANGVFVLFSTDEDRPENYVWVKIPPSLQSVPEVNALVMVSRANDESELPEVQNVHADGSRTVTADEWTAHTQVGNSYSTSYGDSKSIRFSMGHWSLADTETARELVETAYARGLFRDASYSRGGSYSYSCSETMAQGMLGESWSYGCSYSQSWAKENKSFSAVGRTYSESVTGLYDTGLTSSESEDPDALAAVQASRSRVVGNVYNNNTVTGDTKNVSLTTGNTLNDSTQNGDVVSVNVQNGATTTTSTQSGPATTTSTYNGKLSNTTTINADQDNTTTVTGTSVNLTTQSIVQNTTTTVAQSSISTTGSNDSNDTVGVSRVSSATGLSHNDSVVGVSDSSNLLGMSNSMAITGMNNALNVTGMLNSVDVVGNSNTVRVVGLSSSVDILGAGVSLNIRGATASLDISGPSIQLPVILMVM